MASILEWKFLNRDELILDKHWWQIYEDSFPLSERDSKEKILKAVENNLAMAGCYQLQDLTVAIVVFYCLDAPDLSFIFLNYIAIGRAGRNQGLGARLFQSLISQIKIINAAKTRPYQAIIWEVEDPDDVNTDAELQLRQRRLKFYERLGGKYFKYLFMQPPIDGVTILPMRLMYCLLNQLDITEFELAIINAIYFQKYYVVNHIDKSILNKLLAQIKNNIT